MSTAVALDFETSDSDPSCACALGMVRLEDGAVAGTLYRLIRPPKSRILFSDIHGLYWRDLCGAPTFAELLPEFTDFLHGAEILIAHNAAFDRRVLRACFSACGAEAPGIPFACTVKGSRIGLPQLEHHRLSDVCRHLGIELDHHKAWSDAMAAARIYLWLRRNAGLSDRDMMLKK
ncbi:MAG: 3'-5' exonuclease [Mailhella sp.]|nr:3'-5' exonuclease [Mailhella sp.]